ncbi:MAG: hypothetical protein KKA05_07615 [Alphaproteobacteria bacterium]|nr:hypothetical protein [Alphaproteobacteria bacterium]
MSRLGEFFRAGGIECEQVGDGVSVSDFRAVVQHEKPQQSFSTSTGAAMTTIIRAQPT